LSAEPGQRSRATLLSGAYGRVTQLRRAWYARRPERRRRLAQPVISVGNLVAGGSGKTPVVISIARLLLAHGERPVVLTRGYGRRETTDGVLVVSDGTRVLEPVARSGDEPQLIAQAVQGVPVLVSADRYVAGAFAERTFHPTVSILDDGFQHVQLERDVDLLLVSSADLAEPVLPSGLLREPLEAARFADALLVAGTDDEVTGVARALGHDTAFKITTRYGQLQQGNARVVAFAGIARPRRFFDAVRALGYDVAAELTFRDHYWFTTADVGRIQRSATSHRASLVVTTEKDAVRLPSTTWHIPLATLPMTIDIAPADVFESWLFARLAAVRPPNLRSSEGG
jgi:tetraacyldisaccharide 4'-kinase